MTNSAASGSPGRSAASPTGDGPEPCERGGSQCSDEKGALESAVRTFYKLELPRGALQGTLLIAALGAAALAGFWAFFRRRGSGPAG